jgi:hypothetical protein
VVFPDDQRHLAVPANQAVWSLASFCKLLLTQYALLQKLKAHLRRIGARTFDQMFDALTEICDLFTPDECWNFFCEAGYASG